MTFRVAATQRRKRKKVGNLKKSEPFVIVIFIMRSEILFSSAKYDVTGESIISSMNYNWVFYSASAKRECRKVASGNIGSAVAGSLVGEE